MDPSEEKLDKLSEILLNKYSQHAKAGKAIIGIWQDKAHLDSYLNPTGGEIVPAKISILDSKDVTDFDIEGKDKVAIVAIAISEKEGLEIVFYSLFQPR